MIFQEVDLLKRIPSHVIDEIAAVAEELDVPGGHDFFCAGEEADQLYILEEGGVEIVIPGDTDVLFAVTEPGSVFGWSALVDPRQYTASARSTEPSKVLRIDGDRLLRLFEKHPAEGLTVMRRLAGVIAGRLMRSS